MKHKTTLYLDKEIMKKGKIYAVINDYNSLSQLVEALIKEVIKRKQNG